MKFKKLGATGLDVSVIGLGCMSYGEPQRGRHPWSLGEDAARPFFRAAVDAGINFFDTANAYSDGSSEEITGGRCRSTTATPSSSRRTCSCPRARDRTAAGCHGRRRPDRRRPGRQARGRARNPRAQVALAWLLSKPVVTAPIVGATKPHHFEDAVAAVDVELTPEEVAGLEEPYVPHGIVGYA
jgi:aryl-alcohol dehydrogenase-like predicted oxidoreductase